jgi:hypothetical protein
MQQTSADSETRLAELSSLSLGYQNKTEFVQIRGFSAAC